MTSCLLNVDQSPAELNRIYQDDYYWYLRDQVFCDSVVRVVGDKVNELGGYCLDVGCGEGQLSDYVTTGYLGFDGSQKAIENARRLHPGLQFKVSRFETPPSLPDYQFDTVVFSNLLTVLVKPDSHVLFIQKYLRAYSPLAFIVVDLLGLDTKKIEKVFHLTSYEEMTAPVPDLMEVKRHRKVLVFECP